MEGGARLVTGSCGFRDCLWNLHVPQRCNGRYAHEVAQRNIDTYSIYNTRSDGTELLPGSLYYFVVHVLGGRSAADLPKLTIEAPRDIGLHVSLRTRDVLARGQLANLSAPCLLGGGRRCRSAGGGLGCAAEPAHAMRKCNKQAEDRRARRARPRRVGAFRATLGRCAKQPHF